MTTAIAEPVEVTTAPALGPQERLAQMLQAIAKGATADSTEIRNLCFDAGISRKKFDRLLRDAIRRHTLPKEREERRKKFGRLTELTDGREAVYKKCEAKIADLMREVEKQKAVAFAEVTEYDREHGAEIAQLRHLQSGDRGWEDDYQKTMVRTADRRIGFKIAELNTQLLQLQPELESCYAALNEKKQFDEVIEHTGVGPRLVSRTPITRDWWQARFNEAASVCNDPESPPGEKRKYERLFHTAGARLDAIDTATKRIQEIHAQQSSIRKEIERVRTLFYTPEFLHIDIDDAGE